MLEQEQVKNTGAQKQWSFSYGANIADKIFLGAGIGFSSLRYKSSKTYTESNYFFVLDPQYRPLDNMVLNEELVISGSGINANLGIIARPVDVLQVGLSYTTPTLYQLSDSYSASMNTRWNNFDYYGDNSIVLNNENAFTQLVTSDYTYTAPGKLSLGATGFIQKQGFITVDAEFVNYNKAKYSTITTGISYTQENNDIKALYQPTVNYRVGGEYRLKDFRARAGFAYMPDPFRTKQNGTDRTISSLSGGLGYRGQKFYVDVATIFSSGNTSYRPYNVGANSPLVTTKNKNTSVILTLGFPL